MRDKHSIHLKVQELVDCFATTDPLKEMSGLEEDEDEAALKWLALAALHGINANAKKIILNRTREGQVSVSAEYREAALPPPGPKTGAEIIESIRGMTYLDGDKGKSDLALGIRDGSIELRVTLKKTENEESVTLKFKE